jgi:hypothetical protein
MPRQPGDQALRHVHGLAPAVKTDAGRSHPSRRSALKGLAALGAAELIGVPAVDRAVAEAPAAEDPVVVRVRQYCSLLEEALHRSRAWRERVDALRRRGFDSSPSYDCGGMMFALTGGDTSAIAASFDAGIAAASDRSSRSAMMRERKRHLRRANQAYRRWCAAARELGVEEASALNDAAWDALDALELEALWEVEPRTITAAVALLRLVRSAGLDCGCDPEDYAGPARALDQVIAFLEKHGAGVG